MSWSNYFRHPLFPAAELEAKGHPEIASVARLLREDRSGKVSILMRGSEMSAACPPKLQRRRTISVFLPGCVILSSSKDRHKRNRLLGLGHPEDFCFVRYKLLRGMKPKHILTSLRVPREHFDKLSVTPQDNAPAWQVNSISSDLKKRDNS